MATVFNDYFNLPNGTPLLGVDWVKHDLDPAALIEVVDGAVLSSHNGRVVLATQQPLEPDQVVSATIQTRGLDNAGLAGIVGRHRKELYTGYLFGFDPGSAWGGIGTPGFVLRHRYINEYRNFTDKVLAGVPTVFSQDELYYIEMKFNCVRIRCRVRRESDHKYLLSDGTWANGVKNCIDLVDQSFPTVESAYAGLLLTNSRSPTLGTVPTSFSLKD